MRAYKPKGNVQAKSYYNDRFFIKPTLQRKSVFSDSTFSADYLSLKNILNIDNSYLELDHLVIYINHNDNIKAIKHLRDVRAYDFSRVKRY